MIDTRNRNYLKTLSQIAELHDLTSELEKNVPLQLPQGIANKLISSKDEFMNWVEEAEFVLQNYKV